MSLKLETRPRPGPSSQSSVGLNNGGKIKWPLRVNMSQGERGAAEVGRYFLFVVERCERLRSASPERLNVPQKKKKRRENTEQGKRTIHTDEDIYIDVWEEKV